MVAKEPERRPSMEDAAKELNRIISLLTHSTLRARLRSRRDDNVINFLKDVQHFFRTAFYLLLFIPAIPTPPPALENADRKGSAILRPFRALFSRLVKKRPKASLTPV